MCKITNEQHACPTGCHNSAEQSSQVRECRSDGHPPGEGITSGLVKEASSSVRGTAFPSTSGRRKRPAMLRQADLYSIRKENWGPEEIGHLDFASPFP